MATMELCKVKQLFAKKTPKVCMVAVVPASAIPEAFDEPLSKDRVLRIVRPFIH